MSSLAVAASPKQRASIDPHRIWRFSVSDYHKMIEAGILTANDRAELLEGWIVNKMSQNPPHMSSTSRINRWLGRVLPASWSLRCQGPITLSDSQPEPDITIARGEEGTYDKRHPRPSDIGVLMEVGDSTLLEDRRYKGEIYAREKVSEFWLINLVDRKIEVYTRPRAGKYQKKADYAEDAVIVLVLDGVRIADVPVRDLLTSM